MPIQKVGVIILVMGLCLFYSSRVAGETPAATEPLATALTAAGAELRTVDVNGWTEMADKPVSDDQAEHILRTVMRQLGIKEQACRLTHERTGRRRQSRIDGQGTDFRAVAMLQTVELVTPNRQPVSQAYLIINVGTDGRNQLPIRVWQQKVKDITKQFGNLPRITTCLVGCFGGKLIKEHWARYMDRAFAALEATVTDKLDNERFSSYAGYSPIIADSLDVVGKQVNIQVAVRYSSYDNHTYMFIGSPVITREY